MTTNNARKYLTPNSTSILMNQNEIDKIHTHKLPAQSTPLTLMDFNLKLNTLQEPTTPIDKLNTPRTVTVKTATFFPPSPPLNQNNESELNLTGKFKIN
jgi:hypothetical protein